MSGSKAGTSDIFADNLVGLPDNISPASSGGYWVAMGASRHSGLLDMLYRNPWIRNLVAKVRISNDLIVPFRNVAPSPSLPLPLSHTQLRLTNVITQMIAPKTGVIVRLSAEGSVEEVLGDVGGEVISEVSGVLDMGDHLYLGSYLAPYIGRLDLA